MDISREFPRWRFHLAQQVASDPPQKLLSYKPPVRV
jgi:hypothetical protein